MQKVEKKFVPTTYEIRLASLWRDIENMRGEHKQNTHKLSIAISKARAGQKLEWRDWEKIQGAVAKMQRLYTRQEIL